MPSPTDPVPALLAGTAHQLLGAMVLSGAPPTITSTTVSDGGWRITILCEPASNGHSASDSDSQLTVCERDVLLLLGQERDPMTTPRILAALAQRGIEHGESTVRHALARLVRLGLILSSRRAPRGYRVAPGSPRLRQVAAG